MKGASTKENFDSEQRALKQLKSNKKPPNPSQSQGNATVVMNTKEHETI